MDSSAPWWITTASKVRLSSLTRRMITPSALLIRWLHDWLARSHLLLVTRTINLADSAETVHRKWSRAKLFRVLISCWLSTAGTAGNLAVFTTWKAANTCYVQTAAVG